MKKFMFRYTKFQKIPTFSLAPPKTIYSNSSSFPFIHPTVASIIPR